MRQQARSIGDPHAASQAAEVYEAIVAKFLNSSRSVCSVSYLPLASSLIPPQSSAGIQIRRSLSPETVVIQLAIGVRPPCPTTTSSS